MEVQQASQSIEFPVWIGLEPAEIIEALGTVAWTVKNRIIVLSKRIMDSLPDLKNQRKIVLYKLELFLSRSAYEQKTKQIIEGKEPLPLHLYLHKENDDK